jgi:8-oxo-dGTP pyrophosphatase MutT (NUDIX family)
MSTEPAAGEPVGPATGRLADHVPADAPASVVGLVERGDTMVFVVPGRFLRRPGDSLAFHNVGGKRQPGEGWLAALQRESMEEIGVRLEVLSAPATRYLTTAGELDPVDVADEPRPYCIYHRTREVDPRVTEPAVAWIVGYQARIDPRTAVEPQSEIAAVLLLTPELVRATASRRVTYADIAATADGSELLVHPSADLDRNRVAVPAGLAALPALLG